MGPWNPEVEAETKAIALPVPLERQPFTRFLIGSHAVASVYLLIKIDCLVFSESLNRFD